MDWLTKTEAMKLLNISHTTLDRWLKAGKLSYYKSSESRSAKVLISRQEVLDYIKKRIR